MPTDCVEQCTLWDIGSQEVTVRFDGGRVVADAGLLSLRAFDKKLGLIAELAQRLPDPRSQEHCSYSCADLLAQRVYQILAGYPDANDAQTLRHDPLFQTLLDVSPDDEDNTLASGSTLNRFQYAYTRRQAQLPVEDRPVLLEQQVGIGKGRQHPVPGQQEDRRATPEAHLGTTGKGLTHKRVTKLVAGSIPVR